MDVIVEAKGFQLLVELFIKSTCILLITFLVSFFMRKKSSSFRHLLVGVSLLSLLILPFISMWAPGWGGNFFPSMNNGPLKVEESNAAISMNLESISVGQNIEKEAGKMTGIQSESIKGRDTAIMGGSSDSSVLFKFGKYGLIGLWILGAGFFLLRIVAGLLGASRLTRGGTILKGNPWKHLFLIFLEKISLKRKVRIMRHDRVGVPMTWGIFRPVILMPTDSSNWKKDQCSSIFFHELSHVKRGDFLVRLLCWMSCCIYWFNPLVWLGLRKLTLEQEKACDEMVLKMGIKPSVYANDLLRVKLSLNKKKLLPSPAIGMAGYSELSERLEKILKKQSIIKEVKMKTKVILMIVIFFTVVLIGTAKPNQVYNGSNNEKGMVESTQVSEEKEVEEKKECEEEKEIEVIVKKVKCKKNAKEGNEGKKKVNVFIKKQKEGKEKGEKIKKFKKIIKIDGDSGIDIIEEIECDGDYIIIKNDGKLKKIKIDSKDLKHHGILDDEMFLKFKGKNTYIIKGKGDGEKMVWVSKDGKNKRKSIDKHVWVEKKDGKEGDEEHNIILYSEIKSKKEKEKLSENMKALEKALQKIEKEKLGSLEALNKHKKSAKILKDKKLQEILDNISQELEIKAKIQAKALKEMEDALKKMEEDLKQKEMKFKNIAFSMDDEHADHKIEIIKGKKGKHMAFFSDLDIKDQKGMVVKIYTVGKLSSKELKALKKEVDKLKKKLPKSCKVELTIKDESQKIYIHCPEENIKPETQKKIQEEIEEFQKKLEKILPKGEEGKTIKKDIIIKKRK
jgi:beta-lactamase regulating signal transducer with metallopeptidase domain